MPCYIVKLSKDKTEYYLEWSTVSDAPRTFGMSFLEFKRYYLEEYGKSSMDELEKRLERVEKYGSSSLANESAMDIFRHNRAGPDERTLTKKEIIDWFCIKKEDPV